MIKVCGRFVSFSDGKWPQDLIMIIGSPVLGVLGVLRGTRAEQLVIGESGGTNDRPDGDHCIGTREGPGDR